MSSSGSTLCRRLWIKYLCHDIIHSHYNQSPLPTTLQQTRRLSSQVNYQPPLTFLTPRHTAKSASLANTTVAVSRKAMEKRILELVKSNQMNDAQCMLTDIYRSGRTPSIVMYNHIIKALAKQFRNQHCQVEAHTLLDDMARYGVPPNAQTYIQLLLGYILHTNPTDTIRQMQLFIDQFFGCEQQHGYKRTHQKINKLVEMMAGVGQGATILSVMEASVKAGVILDLATWHVALSGCIKGGDLAMAEQLLDIMQQHKTPKPDATTYDIVIGGYLDCDDNQQAIELFQKMMDNGVVADYRTYQRFLCAYTGQSDSNNLDTLQRLWQAMVKTMPANQGLGDGTLVMLLECYLQHQCYSAMEQVYWDLRQRSPSFSRRSVIYFYKAISGFAQQQHLISGIAMFYDLLMDGHGPNHSTTSALLRACVIRGQLDMAQQILDVIEETLGKPAHMDHYATMVKAYVQQGQLDMASKMFTKVQQQFRSTGSTSASKSLSLSYQAMIRGHFTMHQGDMADSLFTEWLKLQNDSNTNNTGTIDARMTDVMVEGYGLLGDFEKLDAFLSRADVDISNIRTRTILIQARLEQGNVEMAERDLKVGLEHTGIKTLQSSVQAVLSGMALHGNVTTCEYWAGRLSEEGLMNDASYVALLVCYGKAGDKVKLQRAYDDLNQRGIQLEDGIENKVKLKWLETDVYS